MSSNRLMYDTCQSQKRVIESESQLDYLLNPVKYENQNKCRHQLGLMGGANVSHIQGNLVDLETDLLGITRKYSLCPNQKYFNPCAMSDNLNNCQYKNIKIKGNHSTKERLINTEPLHLQNCQMIRYKPVPVAENNIPNNCDDGCSGNPNNPKCQHWDN